MVNLNRNFLCEAFLGSGSFKITLSSFTLGHEIVLNTFFNVVFGLKCGFEGVNLC